MDYQQIICTKCKRGLVPIFEPKQDKLGLYCQLCKMSWTIHNKAELYEG